MKNKIWLSSPHIGDNEINYVKSAFETNWIAPIGPNIENFEKSISRFLGEINTCVLSSGTSALHLALVMLGITKEDIVLVQSFTFCGSTSPIKYVGAIPVFIDSEKDTWNMCPEALEKALKKHGSNVKAIIPVHLYGMPYQVDQITILSKKYSVPIIEDAAEALGSKYGENYCGTFGEISALSFNGNKIITTSGGGALVSKNIEYVNKAKFLSTQARDNAVHYQHSEIGFNYRMSNVLAGIGIGQMEVLGQRIKQRRDNNKKYRDFFKHIEGVEFQTEPSSDYYSNYWLTSILINPELTGGIEREDIRIALEKENIESRPLWKPMHLQPIYKGSEFYGDGVCEKLFENGLCLPSGSNLTSLEFERIFKVLERVFKKK